MDSYNITTSVTVWGGGGANHTAPTSFQGDGNTLEPDNECQVCQEVPYRTRQWYILQLLLPILTLVANSLTCYALCRARGIKLYLRVTLLNLSVTDLASCLVYLYHIVFAWNSFQVNAECLARYVIFVTTVILTLLTVLFMSVDRCWSVFMPFVYERLAGTSYLLGAFGSIWLITAVYVTIGFTFTRPDAEGCFYPLLMRTEIHFLYSVASLAVIVAIVVINVTMFLYARHHMRRAASTLVGEARRGYLTTTTVKATVTTVCIVVPFVLLNTPCYCLMLYFGLQPTFTKTSRALYAINGLSNLAFFNALINPAIYVWRSNHVRQSLDTMFRCFTVITQACRRRRQRSQSALSGNINNTPKTSHITQQTN